MKSITTTTLKQILPIVFLSAVVFLPSIGASAVAVGGCNSFGEWVSSPATVDAPVSQISLTSGPGTTALMQAIKGTDGKSYTRVASSFPYTDSEWTAWEEGNGITISAEPELTEFGSGSETTVLESAFGTDKGLYTRTATAGTTWTNWVRGGSITLKSRPVTSYLATGDFTSSPMLVQTGFGTDSGLYTRTSTDGTIWTDWVRGGGITLASKPEQVFFNSNLIQLARGTDNGLYSRYTPNGTTWTDWLRNSGGITVLDETSTTSFDFGVSPAANVKLQQVARGTDKGIYFRNSTDGLIWSDWSRLGSETFSDKPFIITASNTSCGGNFVMRLLAKGDNTRLYSVENGGIDSANFNFSGGLSWAIDSGITLGNTPKETDFMPNTSGSSLGVQTTRGSDNKVYTRVLNPSV